METSKIIVHYITLLMGSVFMKLKITHFHLVENRFVIVSNYR